MLYDTLIAEKHVADMKANQYRSEGYEVFRDVVLDFLHSYRADLVVRKDGHSKVIEVMTRSSLNATGDIAEIAQQINDQPDWSFELLLVGEPERQSTPLQTFAFEEHDISQRLDEAESTLAAGYQEPAFLLAWSATEAAARVLLAARGVTIHGITSAAYVLNQAAFHDAIQYEEYERLRDLIDYRNAIVHGFRVTNLDNAMVTNLIAVARRFVASARPAVDFMARIDELRTMKDGWLMGSGVAPDQTGLHWLATTFPKFFPSDAPLPFINVTATGGIDLVWSRDAITVSLEIDLENHRGRLFTHDRRADVGRERELDLDDAGDWAHCLEEIRNLAAD